MWIKLLILLLLSLLSAVLYRMGGSEGFNTKFRDLGVPTVATLALFVLGVFHWSLILHFGLLFGALTTYWNFKKDVKWWNWLLTGLFYGLSALPLLFCGIGIFPILLRSILLAVIIMVWNTWFNKPLFGFTSDVITELGRGFVVLATIPVLFL